jgi:hypothetical protein
MRWTILCIAACWLLGAEPAPAVPHGGNAGPAQGAAGRALPSDLACLNCHPGQGDVLAGPMATRRAEREFACRAFGREGEAFFSAACAGCHVSQCRDCHEGEPHARAGTCIAGDRSAAGKRRPPRISPTRPACAATRAISPAGSTTAAPRARTTSATGAGRSPTAPST